MKNHMPPTLPPLFILHSSFQLRTSNFELRTSTLPTRGPCSAFHWAIHEARTTNQKKRPAFRRGWIYLLDVRGANAQGCVFGSVRFKEDFKRWYCKAG